MLKPWRIVIGAFLFGGILLSIWLNSDGVAARVVTPVSIPTHGAWVPSAHDEVSGFLGTVTRIDFGAGDGSSEVTVASGSQLTASRVPSTDAEAGPGHSRLVIHISEGKSTQLDLYQPAPDLLLVSDHSDTRSFTVAIVESDANR